MIEHLLKLVWNRKRSNLLIMLEVLCSFLVVFGLFAAGLHLLSRYREPLGYEYRDVWSINATRAGDLQADWKDGDAEVFRRLIRELEGMSPVLTAAVATNAPYSDTYTGWGWEYEGRKIEAEAVSASASYAEVLDVPLLRGRWFAKEDRALAWEPVVIDRELSLELFGEADPLGRSIYDVDRDVDTERRVVGVVAEFKRGGEFTNPDPIMFVPAREYADDGIPLNRMLIKVAPDTRAEFEEELTTRLESVAGHFTFSVRRLEMQRSSYMRGHLIPLMATGIVGGFMLIMVVLGLTGVMWQNVTRRTKEMGLRRAAGAWRSSIHRQIVAEVMVTAGFGVAIGVMFAVQVPLLKLFPSMPFDVVLVAVVLSSIFMLGLAAVCGLYPGWTATRIPPAEALHYE